MSPVQLAWVLMAVLGAVALESSPAALLSLPAALISQLSRTPAAQGPAVAFAFLLVGAVLLHGRRHRRLERAWWFVAGTAAIAFCVWFFRSGDLDWTSTNDWVKEWTYATAWREALRDGRLPWFLAETFQGTNQMLANPEAVVAPHVVLLRWMTPGAFLTLNAALCAGLGTAALARLCQELDLSPLVAFALLAVYLINGHVVSHLYSGHLQWITCWLLPCIFLFLFRAGTGRSSARTAIGLAGSLTLIVMLGGWHVFVWCVIVIAAWTLSDRSRWRFSLMTAAWTAGLIACRLVPAAAVFASSGNVFLGGYPSVGVMVAAFVGEPRDAINGLSWWEYDAFIGWVGFTLVCAGAAAAARHQRRSPVGQFWLPSVVLVVLSSVDVYKWTLFHLPGFVSERVATRLIWMSVLGFACIGSVALNGWAAQTSYRHLRTVTLTAAGASALQMLLRANTFRPAPAQLQAALPHSVLGARHVPLAYAGSVWAGAAISLAVLGLALREWFTERAAH